MTSCNSSRSSSPSSRSPSPSPLPSLRSYSPSPSPSLSLRSSSPSPSSRSSSPSPSLRSSSPSSRSSSPSSFCIVTSDDDDDSVKSWHSSRSSSPDPDAHDVNSAETAVRIMCVRAGIYIENDCANIARQLTREGILSENDLETNMGIYPQFLSYLNITPQQISCIKHYLENKSAPAPASAPAPDPAPAPDSDSAPALPLAPASAPEPPLAPAPEPPLAPDWLLKYSSNDAGNCKFGRDEEYKNRCTIALSDKLKKHINRHKIKDTVLLEKLAAYLYEKNVTKATITKLLFSDDANLLVNLLDPIPRE